MNKCKRWTPVNQTSTPSFLTLRINLLSRSLLESNNLLLSNSGLHGDVDLVLPISPGITDLLGHILRNRGKVDIGLLVSPLVHEGELAFLSDIDDFPLSTGDDGDGGSVGGGDHILELLAGEDVDGGEIAFSVAVLSGLGDGDVKDLAGLSFDHDVSVFASGFGMRTIVSVCQVSNAK